MSKAKKHTSVQRRGVVNTARLQVNREFIQVRNVQSSKLRRTAHAPRTSYGELASRRGKLALTSVDAFQVESVDSFFTSVDFLRGSPT